MAIEKSIEHDKIEECFAEWKKHVLKKYDMDYYFRDEHENAFNWLIENWDKCPEETGKPPIDPDTQRPIDVPAVLPVGDQRLAVEIAAIAVAFITGTGRLPGNGHQLCLCALPRF